MKRLIPIILILLLLLTACGEKSVPQSQENGQPTTGLEDETARNEDGLPDETAEPEPEQELEDEPAEDSEQTPAVETAVQLSDEQRYQLNIFLSNFSEQDFGTVIELNEDTNTLKYLPGEPFDARTADPMELVDFTWIFTKANVNDAVQFIEHEGCYYYGVNIATLDKYAKRFFDRTLELSDIQTGEWIANIGYSIVAVGDMVCMPAADGETYSGLSVADHLYDLGDGTMRAEFIVYEATDYGEDGITSIGGINNRDIYYITADEAAAHPELKRQFRGTALLRPYTQENGRETYQLITYELHEN